MIDTWNKEGLIRSSVDSSISKDLFLKGKTAYFFTGPWNLSDIRKTPGLHDQDLGRSRRSWAPGASRCRSSASRASW